jgi:uncharacterized membrane protein YqjE
MAGPGTSGSVGSSDARFEGTPSSGGGGGEDLHQKSIGELLKQLSEETSTLVKQELDLAKAEMTEKGKSAGVGAGFLGGGALLGLGAFAAFTTFLIALIQTAVNHTWLAALIVTAVYGAIAAFLALRGKDKIQEATPPAPEQTVETLKEDVEWAKTQTRSGAR